MTEKIIEKIKSITIKYICNSRTYYLYIDGSFVDDFYTLSDCLKELEIRAKKQEAEK